MLAAGLPGLRFNADYKAYFDPDDPFLQQLSTIEKRFETTDNIVVILSRQMGSILEPEAYRLLTRLTERAWELPYIHRVQSIASLPLPSNVDEGSFFEEGQSGTSHGDKRLDVPDISVLSKHPRVSGLLISEDTRTAAINLFFHFPAQDTATELPHAADAVRRLVEDTLSTKPNDIESYLTGTVMLGDNYVNVVLHDLRLFIPCLLLMFLGSLTWFFYSWRLAVLTLVTAILAVIMASGMAGWMKFELASINAFAPVMIISLSIATSVHMITAYLRKTSDGIGPTESATYSLQFNWLAVCLTTLTTTAGFLGLAFSPSPPVRTIGFIVAFGNVAALILNCTLVPMFLARRRLGARRTWCDGRRLSHFATWIVRARKAIITGMLLASAVTLWCIPANEIDDNVIQYFPTSNAFRVATDLANNRLSGITIVDYSLDTNKENGIFDPEYLNTVAAFAGWFKKQEFVTRISAVTDWLTLFDQDTQISHFTEGDVSRYARRLANRRPSELNLSHEITQDYSATRLRAFINNSDNRNIVHLDHKAREWLKDNASQYEVMGGAGPSLVFAHIGHRNVQGMLYSLLIAVSVTAVLIGMVTRSLYAILICLVCNLIPIVWVFGIWTLLDGRLSLGAAVVVGMILGIIVDDSIHFIVKYFVFSRQAIGSGLSPLEQVYAKVGPALVATTLTLAAGLAVGCLSDFRPISVMSALSVAIIIVALVVDLTLLPALLTAVPQRSNRNAV